jgi:hypothetical protein
VQDHTDPNPAAEAAAEPFATVNAQVLDSLAAIQALTKGAADNPAAAMVELASAQAIALGQLQAVIRQQADATIASATTAAACAQILGAPLPPGPGAHSPNVAVYEQQARLAVDVLKARVVQAGQDAEAATAALARIAAAVAAPSPKPAAAEQ